MSIKIEIIIFSDENDLRSVFKNLEHLPEESLESVKIQNDQSPPFAGLLH